MTASGKIADAMVFFGWKGIAVVRQWLIPANRESADQGDVRVILGGLGRSAKVVVSGSQYHIDATSLATGGTTWVSQLVKFIRATYMSDATAFIADLTAYNLLANVALWDSNAATLGLTVFNLAYKGMASPFSPGLQLYSLARYAKLQHAIDPTIFTAAIYGEVLSAWDGADFTAFIADLQTVV